MNDSLAIEILTLLHETIEKTASIDSEHVPPWIWIAAISALATTVSATLGTIAYLYKRGESKTDAERKYLRDQLGERLIEIAHTIEKNDDDNAKERREFEKKVNTLDKEFARLIVEFKHLKNNKNEK